VVAFYNYCLQKLLIKLGNLEKQQYYFGELVHSEDNRKSGFYK
jgi:hypothetical protein